MPFLHGNFNRKVKLQLTLKRSCSYEYRRLLHPKKSVHIWYTDIHLIRICVLIMMTLTLLVTCYFIVYNFILFHFILYISQYLLFHNQLNQNIVCFKSLQLASHGQCGMEKKQSSKTRSFIFNSHQLPVAIKARPPLQTWCCAEEKQEGGEKVKVWNQSESRVN